MVEGITLPEGSDASLEKAFKEVDADTLVQLGKFVEEALLPLPVACSDEQRQVLVMAINAFMVDESDDPAAKDALNDKIDDQVKAIVTQYLGVDNGDKHDDLCDQICDALDEAVEETAVYGQMKGHEMMGEIFGIPSTGPVRCEGGEVFTTVAMGGAARNTDGSWTEFGDDLGKVG